MKTFFEQFRQCAKDGMHGKGEFKKFKDNIQLLPHPILANKAARKVAKALELNPDVGLQTISCLRFGGECSSKHTQCQSLRKGLLCGIGQPILET